MSGLLRLSVSLDGKLMTSTGKPSRKGIPISMVESASEIQFIIHPVICGGVDAPALSGLPGVFLPKDLKWELLSTAKGSGGTITARYRRKELRERRASRRYPAAA